MSQTHTDPFLALAQEAYTESTNWFDAGPRREIEADLREIKRRWPHVHHFHLHMHDARGMALPCLYAAVRTLEAEDTVLIDGTLDAVINQHPQTVLLNAVRIFTNLREQRNAHAGVEPVRISIVLRENLP